MHNRRRWVLRVSPEENESLVYPEFSSIIAGILRNRGIDDLNNIKKFLNPRLGDLYDPYLLPDMDTSVNIIKNSIESSHRIVIYGDYDADGVTSTALLYSALKDINADIHYYIPRRDDEGYGLNFDAIDEIVSKGTGLIITVDCGTSSISEVEYCRKLGSQIIVTDHHECGDILPDAPVINPKRHDSSYPFKELSGAGVAFKLVQALCKSFSSIDPFKYLDLAAVGTIADVVPLLDENRIIAKYGLSAMKDTSNLGLKALLEVSGIDNGKISSGTVSFSVSPRINAIGRIDDANYGVKLFTSKDRAEAIHIASRLDEANRIRQGIEEKIFKDAEEKAELVFKPRNDLVFVMESDEWNKGVVGIAASKIVEKYYRPAVLLCREGNLCRGSARSIPGINIYEALKSCQDLMIKFGGHALAAGLTISSDNVDKLYTRINEYVKSKIPGLSLIPSVFADFELVPDDISVKLADELEKLEPFGAGNPSPVFVCRNFKIQDIRPVGAEDKHLKMRLLYPGYSFDAIAFNMGYNKDDYSKGSIIDVAFQLDNNTWNGQKNVQLVIKDIRPSILKSFEDDYFRGLKNFVEKFSDGKGLPQELSKLRLYEKPVEKVLDDTLNSPGSLIFIGNINSLSLFSGYEEFYDIYFIKSPSPAGNKPKLILNPEIGDVNTQGISNIYIMDNLVDYGSIVRHAEYNKGIRYYICSLSADNDIRYLAAVKPSSTDIEKVFSHLKKSMTGGKYSCSIDELSFKLSLNKLKTYYIVRALLEAGMISVSVSGANTLLILLKSSEKNNLENCEVIEKFYLIHDMLNKINIYFQKIKGEYK